MIVHTSVPGVTSSSCWIDGSATFTIVTSSRIMNWEKQVARRVQRWRAGLMAAGYSSTCPLTQVTVWPATQMLPSASRDTVARPARPRAVP